MAALLGTFAFIITAGAFVRWAIRKKKKDIEKRKAAKVIKFDVTETFYDN